MNLLMAIYHEHQARTRHDVFNEPAVLARLINCDVCLYINAEKQRLDRAKADYYKAHDSASEQASEEAGIKAANEVCYSQGRGGLIPEEIELCRAYHAAMLPKEA